MSDTLVQPGSDVGTGDTPTPSGSSGGISSWSPRKKILILGGGGFAVLAAAYLFIKHKSSASASTASTSSNSTTPTLVLPSSDQDATSSTDYASLEESLDNLSNQVSKLKDTAGTPGPPGKTGPAGPTGPSGGGSGTTSTTLPKPYFTAPGPAGVGILDVLGSIPTDATKAGLFAGYNIAGGSPVYADVPGSNKWQLGLKGSQLTPGTILATPAADWKNVVPGKVTNEQLP